jgi:RNase P protein component
MIPKKYRFSLRSDPLFFEKALKLFFDFGVVFYVKNGLCQDITQDTTQDTTQDINQDITQETTITKTSKDKKSPILVAGIVPKKQWTKASQRNQQKRDLRAALTSVCQSYTSTQQLTAVVYLNKNPISVQKLSDAVSKSIAKIT